MANPNKNKIDHKFHKILQGEDDLGVVIRTQIVIERQLNEMLGLLCPNFEILEKKIRLSYYQKVYLAEALGLTPEVSGILRVLGGIRNDFAHKPDMEIDNSNVSKLYAAFSPEGKKILQNTHNTIRKNAKNKVSKSFIKLAPKDKFILLALTIQLSLKDDLILKKESLETGEIKVRCECGKENQPRLVKKSEESQKFIKWSCPQCGKGYQLDYAFKRS